MTALFLLGFVLGFDSFRVSVSLGILDFSSMRQSQIALAFGLCDGSVSLVALAVGQSWAEDISRWTEVLCPLTLGGYGVYVIYLALRCDEAERDVSGHWMIFGFPIALSVDNLVVGLALSTLGFPVLLSAMFIGAISGMMSLVGLKLGASIKRHLPIRSEPLSGVVIFLVAATLTLDVG